MLRSTGLAVDLHEFRDDIYSQSGEDGIIAKVLEVVGIQEGFFVELGAWDGEHLSNCRSLIDRGWRGCFIEGDPRRYRELCRNIAGDQVIKINAYVGVAGDDCLDRVLRRSEIESVDLLSIDIDSDDLALWRSLEGYRPAVVVIEYNPTIPFDTRYVNPVGQRHGNSALSIAEHAAAIGYDLIEGTPQNLILVAAERNAGGAFRVKSLQEIKDRLDLQSRYFFGFDGTLLTESPVLRDAGITELFWIPWSRVVGHQPVPRWLRRYSDQPTLRSSIRRVVVPAMGFVRSPVQLTRLVGRQLRQRLKRRGGRRS